MSNVKPVASATQRREHAFACRARGRTWRAALTILFFSAAAVVQAQVSQTWLNANANNDWSLTAPNWNGNVGWTNGNDAIFGGATDAVEIASDVTVRNLTFNVTGYTIADADAGSVFSLSSDSIITVGNSAHTATISEIIAAGALTKSGAGTLVLSGANAFSGAVSVTAGTLSLANNSALGDTTGTTSITAGQIELQNGVTITGETLTLGSAGDDLFGGLRTATNATATWNGPVVINSGARVGSLAGGTLVLAGALQNGTGTGLVISATGTGVSQGTVRISGTSNTYTGTTSIIRGRLQLGATNALPTGTTLDVDSSTAAEDSIFDLNGFSQTVAVLQRSGSATGGGSFITNSSATAGTLTVNQTATSTYNGIIQDGAGVINLVKSGSGALTLSGNNTFGGTITVSAGTLTLSGTNTLNSTVAVGGTLNLNAANTGSGAIQVNNGGILNLGNNAGLGGTGGSTTVASGGRLVLQNGVTVTGESLTLSGSGGNNNGALQTADNATATWAGNITTVVVGTETRLGGGVNGTLNINGVISGSGSVLFGRANNSTTVLNAQNTFAGDTQMFANAGTGARLVMGVDNALSGSSRLSVILAATATVSMTMDLNGKVLTLSAMDTSTLHASGAFLFVQNNSATNTASTLTLSGTGISAEQVFNGRVNNGTSTGGLSVIKNGSYTQTFVAAQGYTGTTTINAGTVQLGKASATGYTGSSGSLASANVVLNGGTLALDNLGLNNNGADRLADSATVSFRGGSMVYRGSEVASSTETIGTLELHSRRSVLTSTFGGTNAVTITVGNLSRPANGGQLFVNGVNLGLNDTSTASISRIIVTTPPDLVGTTPAASTGVTTTKTTQIVPWLIGESAAGVGTATGTANTFVTYNAATGLRPLSLTDEFTSNAFTADHNVFITGAATLGAGTTSINSLLIAGTDVTIGTGKVLNVASGAIFLTSGNNQTIGGGGDLTFSNREAIISTNAGGNTNITSRITGTGGVSYYGSGSIVTNQQHTYSGNTALYVTGANGVIPQSSSTFVGNTLVSGPFGTGTLILAGSNMRATSANNISIGNAVDFRADTTIIAGAGTSVLNFTGGVSLTNGTRVLTHNSGSNTTFSGIISETSAGSGLTIAGTGAGAVVLSGNNTYTGPTRLTGTTTLLINGNQSAATGAVTVSAGTLGGSGTIGGATTILTGGTLNPGNPAVAGGLGTLTINNNLTVRSGSTTNLQITSATFTSMDGFGGNVPGTPEYAAYVIANGSGVGVHDQLVINGAFTQETGGKINVTGVSFTPLWGQIFNLLDWTDMLGSNLSSNLGPTYRDGSADNLFDLDLPDISSSGLNWDTSLFASHGIVTAIPEPSRALLVLLGAGMMAWRRRRRTVS